MTRKEEGRQLRGSTRNSYILSAFAGTSAHGSFRMKTLLNSRETSQSNARQFHETREDDKTIQTCHVQATQNLHCESDKCESRENRRGNQGERLFPEFFTYRRASRAAESQCTALSLNRKPEHRLNDPLIHSWLNMYGCTQCYNFAFE